MARKSQSPATSSVVEPDPKVETAEAKVSPSAEAIVAAFPVAAPATKVRAAKLTLSQRRTLLVLADGPVVPASAFRALPLEYLASVGLAVETDGVYTLTDAGSARAASINPAYRDWKAGGSVVGGSFAPDRLGTAKRKVEDARFEALCSNPGVSR